MSHSATPHQQHSKQRTRRTITVHILPTLGHPFTLTCPQNLPIEKFTEDVSDRVGISPKKISLLLRSLELKTGTLSDNGVSDGSEIRLIPSLESGVNTSSATDPLAMMKHSMSGISDQQIDDFLAGKVPLSVAIRLGESVVVVNLNRAKVEDIEMEPPQDKRHTSQGTRTNSTRSGSRDKHTTSLNTNPHWSSSAACTSTTSVTTPPCTVPVRSVIPAGTPVPSADVTSSSSSHIGNTIDEHCHHNLLIHGSSPLPTNRRRQREDTDRSPIPSSTIPTHISSPSTLSSPLPPSPIIDTPSHSSRTIKKARRYSTSKGMGSSSSRLPKIQFSQTEWEELKKLKEAPPTNSGISMKRKAVMEAIGEILKKMYSQRSRGKSPGTFKGRFSSEFTCDNDMQEIIHSRTTMTSYGAGASSRDLSCSSSRRSRMGHASNMGGACGQLTKARYEENETTRSKVELLKWKMHQQKLIRKQKRGRSVDMPTYEFVEGAIDVDLQPPPLKLRKKTGFGGLKRGFLLSD